MKSGWRKWLKVLAAAVLGLALLDLFCSWYYNPAGYLHDEARATDVIREPGIFTSRANEGYSQAVIDANGYNNREVPGDDGVFVLMMGSSHTEGLYVMPGEDVSSQLGERLAERGLDGMVYNIGTSAHNLVRNIFNLDRALTRFAPSGYVILETRTVKLGYRDVTGLLAGSLGRIDASEVVIAPWLSERPLLRTVYRQILTLSGVQEEAEEEESTFVITQEVLDLYQEEMTRVFALVRETADAHGVEPIVFYHPTLLLQSDGTAVPDTDERVLRVFAAACEAGGVPFLDLTDSFLAAYERDHVLPYGFVNTAPGVGHLNAYGNRLVAEALCAEILKREGVQ